ncbi:uncharacterized protein A4U43_C09F14210 [Asparagus officinalis]|uniref:Secreted protein n=1 Tax=Asparagus officinalis TaxID=4686 RepID=A0A5P1E7W5_ASPOF|nr:uncharacterized protein A4U43_C09F14210 [Asparagus officinalis]
MPLFRTLRLSVRLLISFALLAGISRQLFDRPRMEVRYSLSRKLLSQGATANTTTTDDPNRIGDGVLVEGHSHLRNPQQPRSPTGSRPTPSKPQRVHRRQRLPHRPHPPLCRWFSSARASSTPGSSRPPPLRTTASSTTAAPSRRRASPSPSQYANSFPFPMSVSSADCLS